MKGMRHAKARGFTLIELLVVIAIIGILSSTVLASLSTARMKARDAQRILNVKQLQIALINYGADHGSYPNCADPGYAGGCDYQNLAGIPGANLDSSQDISSGNFIAFLRPYMSSIPTDPLNATVNGVPYYYGYASGYWPLGSPNYYYYFVGANLEDSNNPVLTTSLHINGMPYSFYVLADQR
jgi:prepilin-type N-terminal cleavage/methylation domain-containing protein